MSHLDRTQCAGLAIAALALAVLPACSDDDDIFGEVNPLAPQVSGVARYLDTNMNGVVDRNDQVILSFDEDIDVLNPRPEHFFLPIQGDRLGNNITAVKGPRDDQLTITLGEAPSLTIDGVFDSSGPNTPGLPSGIDVADDVEDEIEAEDLDTDVEQSTAVDIAPGFVAGMVPLGTEDALSVRLADIDGDADSDVVFGTTAGGVRIWRNEGNGNFLPAGTAGGTDTVRSIAAVDVDGDLDSDLVLGVAGGGNRVLLNDGAGNFVDSGQALGTADTFAIAAGDVDGDGDADLVEGISTTTGAGAPNRVWLNDGTGMFTDSGVALGTGDTRALALVDVDGDVDLDLVEVNSFDQPTRVFTNTAGAFVDSGQSLGAARQGSLAVADVDGDGDTDLVVGSTTGQPGRVWLNNGTGTFTAGPSFPDSPTASVVVADFDGDGRLDVFQGLTAGSSRLFTGTATGTFADSGIDFSAGRVNAVATGNLSGLGRSDIAFATGAGEPNTIWFSSAG